MRTIQVRALAAACAALLAGGCIENQEAPALSGPSGFGQRVTLTATPDALPRDGAAQSLVIINFHDTGSDQPMSGRTLLVDTTAGALSAGQVVTDGSGNASVVLTAPDSNSFDTQAWVFATPVGSDAANSRSNSVVIGLYGPMPPVADFTVTPESPTAGEQAVFDASPTTFGVGSVAQSYEWHFGDGSGTDNGRIVGHTFASAGAYPVSLTVTDSLGRTAAKLVIVEVEAAPAATTTGVVE